MMSSKQWIGLGTRLGRGEREMWAGWEMARGRDDELKMRENKM